jgi:hypothetical protein
MHTVDQTSRAGMRYEGNVETVNDPTTQGGVEWKAIRFGLTFRFGFVTIGTARFSGSMPSSYFTKWPSHPYHTSLPRIGRNDVFVMRSHPVDAPLPRIQFRDGLLWYVPSVYKHKYTDLTTSFEDYLTGIPPKERSTLRRKVRKLFAECTGEAKVRCYRGPEELSEFYPLARAVSAKTYQERLMKAGLPDTEEFRAEMHDLACRDSARGFLLFVDQTPIAYLYSPAQDSILFYDHLGYDADYAKWSPGTVLQYLAFEELFRERRFNIFDFEEGDGQHKRLFSTHEAKCADVYAFAVRPKTVALVLLHASLGSFTRAALTITEHLGMKKKIKAALKK